MRTIISVLVLWAFAFFVQGQDCQLKVVVPKGAKGGVYSPHGPLGVLPFDQKVNIERSGRIFIASTAGRFVELDGYSPCSSGLTISPEPFELEIDPATIPAVEFGTLEPSESLLQNTVMINGIPAGGSADLPDLANALRDHVARYFPKAKDKASEFRISAKLVKSMAPHTRKPLAFMNYSIIHCIEWKLVEKRTSRVLVEKQLHGGYYMGDLKLTGGQDRVRELREEESYANRMAAVSSLQCFLSDVEVLDALRSVPKTSAGLNEESIKITGTTFVSTIHQTPGSVATVRSDKGFGSAFFISEEGHLLTNDHVVPPGDTIVVLLLNNGFTINARVLRRSSLVDVALLKMDGARVVPLECDPSKRAIGDEVYAIGTPEHQGLSQTITKGIISGFRSIEGRSFIQTDVSINRGNSGGPLLDKNGKVIGMVSAKMIGVGTEGIGFAIPISEAFQSLGIE